jgi:hypothetical protein
LGADVSIRYNAAARLAYGEMDESVDFETFWKKHEQLTVATIVAEKMEKSCFPVQSTLIYPFHVT